MRRAVAWLVLAVLTTPVTADVDDYGANLEGFDYPFPVERLEFTSQRQSLEMAYMDVAPEETPRGTVVLLHGKNFCGAYWEQTIEHLHRQGYRVVAPDQIGFCKSTKPDYYQYTFDQLAANTRQLLESLDIDSVTVLGHSMGGMLATRFALQYPEATEQLILLNPIGLEDWRAEGVPYVSIDELYESEMEKDFESIRAYQQSSYYDGEWNIEYERWARMLAGMYESEQRERIAWHHALTADMVLSQPVLYEFGHLEVPTALLIGLRDRTAIGRGLVDEETAERLGDYPALAHTTQGRIPDATLVEFEDVGHMPHIEAPERYLAALDEVLEMGKARRPQ